MENPTKTEIFADKIRNRAERVRNKRTDVVSKMARGVLNVERWLADRVLEEEGPKIEVPKPLEVAVQDQESFFRVLHDIERGIMTALSRPNPSWAPEQFPKLNMCGYTSSAMTEFLRNQGLEARVVYGHYRNNGEVKYHYWTEANIDDQKYTIDATYGQFDPGLGEKILVYPSNDLDKYGLREYKAEDEPVFGDGDKNTLKPRCTLAPLRFARVGQQRR